MKSRFISPILILFVLTISCGQKEGNKAIETSGPKYNVKLKAGVIMRSGDIKKIVRQDFIITKVDLISLWDTSIAENWIDIKQIEDEIKKDSNYDNKMKMYQEKINKSRLFIKEKMKPDDALNNIGVQLISHLKQSHNLGQTWGAMYPFQRYLINYSPSYEEIKEFINSAEDKYKELLNANLSKEHNSVWSNQYKKFKDIKSLLTKKESEIENESNNTKLASFERDQFNKEVNVKINVKYAFQRKKGFDDFRTKFVNNFIRSFKTNLDGEATFSINKGEFYIFCLAQIIENHIIWNYPIKIENEGQYIELSNDNAYAIDNLELYNNLTEAISGLKLESDSDK